MNTNKRFEFYTPWSMSLWCRTQLPDKYGRHTMSVLYSPEWATVQRRIEEWAEEECGVEAFDFEKWCMRPVSPYAVQEFDGVNEGDHCMQFNSKLYAAKNKSFPVHGPDNEIREHEILSGSQVIIKAVAKFWQFTNEDGEFKEGISLYMENVKFQDLCETED